MSDKKIFIEFCQILWKNVNLFADAKPLMLCPILLITTKLILWCVPWESGRYKMPELGVPTVVQQLENLALSLKQLGWLLRYGLDSQPWHSGLKDLALPQLWHRSQLQLRSKLQLRFYPWPRNFHMLWMRQNKLNNIKAQARGKLAFFPPNLIAK